MKKLNKLKENSQRQFSEFRNKINYQKGYFARDQNYNKEPNRNCGAENLTNWGEKFLQSIGNSTDHIEARINNLKDKNLEVI